MVVFLQTGSSSFCQNLVDSYVFPIREKTPVDHYFKGSPGLDLEFGNLRKGTVKESALCESHLKPISCHGAKGTKSNNKVAGTVFKVQCACI